MVVGVKVIYTTGRLWFEDVDMARKYAKLKGLKVNEFRRGRKYDLRKKIMCPKCKSERGVGKMHTNIIKAYRFRCSCCGYVEDIRKKCYKCLSIATKKKGVWVCVNGHKGRLKH